MKGWVYVISNNAMPGLSKIGYSMKDPELRAAELNHTGSPLPYLVDYEVLVDEPRKIEQAVHHCLSAQREGKEWFRCSPEDSIAAIKSIVGSSALSETFKRADRAKVEAMARKNRELADARHRAKEELLQQEALLDAQRQEISSRYDVMLKAVLPTNNFWSLCSGIAILFFIILLIFFPRVPALGVFVMAAFGGVLITPAIEKRVIDAARKSPQYQRIVSAREVEFAKVEREFGQAQAKNTLYASSEQEAYTDKRQRLPPPVPRTKEGGGETTELLSGLRDLTPKVHPAENSMPKQNDNKAMTTPDHDLSVKSVFIEFSCPYCSSRNKLEDSHLISCPSCGRSSFTR